MALTAESRESDGSPGPARNATPGNANRKPFSTVCPVLVADIGRRECSRRHVRQRDRNRRTNAARAHHVARGAFELEPVPIECSGKALAVK